MSLSYRSTQVMAPSVAPATSNAGATFKVAHRRLNLDGQWTSFSPIGDTNLPATITPQSYSRPTEYLADQILISNDGGTTWKLSPTQAKGAQSVGAFSSGWATVTNVDTQNSILSSIQLGSFSSLSNPEFSFYVYNTGAGIQSFTYSFINQLTSQVAFEYSDLIQVDLDGVYGNSGGSPSTLYDATLVWSNSGSLNTHKLILGAGQFAKLKVKLINFPSGGLGNQELNLSMQVVANQTTFALSLAEEWPNKTFKIDQNDFKADIFVGINSFSVIVRPFIVNYNGRLLVNFFDRQINLGDSEVTRWIAVLDNGSIRAYELEANVPTNSVLIGKLTTTISSPWLTGVEYFYDVKPASWGAVDGANVDSGLFVKFASGNLEATSNGSEAVGISFDGDKYATSGRAWVVPGENLVAGDRVGAGLLGKAFKGGQAGIVLLGGLANERALIEITNSTDPSGFKLIEKFEPTAWPYTLTNEAAFRGLIVDEVVDVVLTIDSFANAGIPVGTQLLVANKGTNKVTFSGINGVLLNGFTDNLELQGNYNLATLWHESEDEWWVSGPITVA